MTLRHGYFSDQGYSYGAYPETSPERLAFVSLLQSHRPPDLGEAFSVLDLGCGQGLGLCLQAACYPQAQFTGIDFNAEHIAHACSLAASAQLSNVHFIKADFLSLSPDQVPGWGGYDIVIAHGVLGWVSPQLGRTLIELAAGALRSGGLFYLSYNVLPGWLDALPLQHAVNHFQRRIGDGQSSLDAAVNLFRQLQKCGSPLLQAHPLLASRLDRISSEDPAYLLHEYNNTHWQPQFSDAVIREASGCEFVYLGSASLLESFSGVLPESFRNVVTSQVGTEQRELVRDLVTNQSFRRDVYAKGRDSIWPANATSRIEQLAFMSLLEPEDLLRPDLSSFRLHYGELHGNRVWFLGLLETLQEGPCSIDALQALPLNDGNPTPLPELLQNLALLLHKGAIALLPPQRDPRPAQRLNATIAAHVAAGAPYSRIAVPRTGGVMPLGSPELMLLHATLEGHRGDALSQKLEVTLRTLNRRLRKDDVELEGRELRQEIRLLAERFESNTLPFLHRLDAVT